MTIFSLLERGDIRVSQKGTGASTTSLEMCNCRVSSRRSVIQTARLQPADGSIRTMVEPLRHDALEPSLIQWMTGPHEASSREFSQPRV